MKLKQPPKGASQGESNVNDHFSSHTGLCTELPADSDLQSSVFVTNPWTFIGEAIRERCPKVATLEAESSLQQP